MKFINDVKIIYEKIVSYEKNKNKYRKLPSGAVFLDANLILITNTNSSGARFPYANEGLTIWAHASGNITINNSSFYALLPSGEGLETHLDFFAVENSNRNPLSLLGVSRNNFEINCKRYVVYTKNICYYLTVTSNFLYCVCTFINTNSDVYFVNTAINLNNGYQKLSLSSYFNLLFKHDSNESVETKWFKTVSYEKNMFLYDSGEDINREKHIDNYGLVKRIFKNKPKKIQNTTSKTVFMGEKNRLPYNSLSLVNEKFKIKKDITNFTDMGINGDIISYNIKENKAVCNIYKISIAHDNETKNKQINEIFDINIFKKDYDQKNKKNNFEINNFEIKFSNLKNKKIDDKLLNNFLKMVNYQIDFASLSSNSGTNFLGVRDVMQQLEVSLLWSREKAREKILEVFSFVDPNGIAPRQYSIPPKNTNIARMDLRLFIDQGLWMLKTLYYYLTITSDYSILDEKIPYFVRIEPNQAMMTDYKESILEHVIKIINYLIKNISINTNCLKALYGDWNDALDGLGLTDKPNEFGDGVSVMATLQLYDLLEEYIEIFNNINYDKKYILEIEKVRINIFKGIKENAIIKKENKYKIVHGWGNEKSYFVGSFNDPDNQNRDSLTSNAFFVISKMINNFTFLKKDILNAFNRLDSKYGLKTFEPYFRKYKGFGRIYNLPKGTAENAATYIHATLFGIIALYKLNESKFANEQLFKILPITHENISTTPFVMPNSYLHNDKLDIDGESMSDWYTGSANTLLKALIRGLFGIETRINKIIIEPAEFFFSNEAEINFMIEDKKIKIKYQNKNNSCRRFYLNNKEINFDINQVNNLKSITIFKEKLLNKNTILILD